MYQYKAILLKTKELVAEGHSLDDVTKQIKHFRRQQKRNEHTRMNEQIEIYHNYRDEGKGTHKEKLIKVV